MGIIFAVLFSFLNTSFNDLSGYGSIKKIKTKKLPIRT